MVGSETTWAEKKREYRNKKTLSSLCPDNQKTKKGQVRQEIEIELEDEKEKYEKLNQKLLTQQLKKDIEIEKLENLAVSKENEILI
ncbi:hypothetical protein ABLL_1357 [Arcobacter sp. L]|nr:hypothetical protein ABLL_1357 [Arcobacter sp. L]